MSYEQDRTLPLPPLREVLIETVSSDVEPVISEILVADEKSNGLLSGVEKNSTRAGGTDPQPELPALREIHVDRKSDVCKPKETQTVNDECECAKKKYAFFSIATWAIIVVFAFWFCSQLLQSASYVLRFSFNDWRFYVTLIIAVIPLALLLFVCYRVVILFRKLPSFPQMCKSGMKSYELKNKLLHEYLEELPESCEYTKSVGFKGNEKEEVVKVLDLLLGKKRAHYSDAQGWLDDFNRFNDLQRSRANKIIGHYSKLIGLKTAASPWKFVDVICVFLNSTLMVADLAKLYNRRVDRSVAFRLVFSWFLNIYISGELGQITETVAGKMGEAIKEPMKDTVKDMGWLDSDWTGMVAQSMPIFAKLAGKVVEGGVNAYFAIRMGKKAVAAFEPLISDGGKS